MCNSDFGAFLFSYVDHIDGYSCLLQRDCCVQVGSDGQIRDAWNKGSAEGEGLIHNPH